MQANNFEEENLFIGEARQGDAPAEPSYDSYQSHETGPRGLMGHMKCSAFPSSFTGLDTINLNVNFHLAIN